MGLRELREAYESDAEAQNAYRLQYPHEAVANAILALRADLGLTQRELADEIGTTQSVIARAESGRHSFGISLLDRIAAAAEADWLPLFTPRLLAGSFDELASNVVMMPSVPYQVVDLDEQGDVSEAIKSLANG